jgi:Tfp pilus assembly protein PilN
MSTGAELIARMAAGDRAAFDALYDRYAPLAYGVIAEILGAGAEGADALHDTFWDSWRHARRYDSADRPEDWLVARARAHAAARAGAGASRAGAARDARPVVPPADVKPRLQRRIELAIERRRLQRLWLTGTLVAVTAMLVGGLLVGGWVAARYEARLGRAARELATLRERARAEQELDELLRDPATRIVVLRGVAAAEARGVVVWNDSHGGQLLASGLPRAPAGKVYALWIRRGGAARPAGVLPVDGRGDAVQRIARADGGVDGFTVTLEPASGAATPTGPTVLASR